MRMTRALALALLGLFPASAFAQTAANPDADAPAELERSSGQEQAEPAPAEAPTEESTPGVVPAAAPAPAPEPAPAAPAPAPAVAVTPAVAESEEESSPEVIAKIAASLQLIAPGATSLAVDDRGTTLSSSPFETLLKVSPELHWGRAALHVELDTATGAVAGLPPEGLFASRTPHPTLSALDLRQLYLEYKGDTWVVRAGQQAALWGLGLVANPGNRDPEPGDFGEPRFGDLSYRALFAGRPLFDLGGAWRAFEPAVGVDLVARDDTADFSEGDRAFQGILALRFAVDANRFAGLYTVYRRQRAEGVTDGGRSTDAFVVDVAAKWLWEGDDDSDLSLGFELVSISGKSTMARSDTAEVLEVAQLGAAAKLGARSGPLAGLLDFGYASGDQNPYDDRLEGFRFDPDFNAGLVLFDHVMGWQSSRTAARASDPMLVGRPPEGVDLLPTRGSVANAWYLFPRLRYGATRWMDVYGGPLFAFSTAALTDAFNTRLNGGEPTNSLGGRPGSYLGTELDLGVQVRMEPHRAVKVVLAAEGGLLLPGSAFARPEGGNLPPVGLGRLRLAVGL